MSKGTEDLENRLIIAYCKTASEERHQTTLLVTALVKLLVSAYVQAIMDYIMSQ